QVQIRWEGCYVVKMRIGKWRMRVFARCRLVIGVAGNELALPVPSATCCSHGRKVKIEIEGGRIGHAGSEVVKQLVGWARVHDVVEDGIVGGVVLNLQLAGGAPGGAISPQGIVDDGAVVRPAHFA